MMLSLSISPVPQHLWLPERVPEDHPADHTGERAEHVAATLGRRPAPGTTPQVNICSGSEITINGSGLLNWKLRFTTPQVNISTRMCSGSEIINDGSGLLNWNQDFRCGSCFGSGSGSFLQIQTMKKVKYFCSFQGTNGFNVDFIDF